MWNRLTSMHLNGARDTETWIRRSEDGEFIEFPVDVYLGKKTNLLNLKKDIVANITSKIDYYRKSRVKLYKGDLEFVSQCPVTGISTDRCTDVAKIYGAEYVQTPDTGHVYVKNRPTKKSINSFYLNDVTYAATYTNKSGAEFRLNAIAKPWLEWVLEVYEKQYGKKPERILDVGSGAGHFVEACRRRGIEAHGIELSQSSRDFAAEIWEIELDGNDFLKVYKDYEGYDIVTFWGLLEHTPNPGSILDCAHSITSASSGGMVISKVPRWDSLSSAAQRLNNDTIIRHIDPMGHIMLFTDASAAELYHKCGFKPTAAWYYGMDTYETLMQVANHTKSYNAFLGSGDQQVELQQFIDEARFSDGLTIVGIPDKK